MKNNKIPIPSPTKGKPRKDVTATVPSCAPELRKFVTDITVKGTATPKNAPQAKPIMPDPNCMDD